ncbi:MAG: ORF6N domain-containing protein [Armatimonadetes bacterium]|nr:ORF6N domain-containing protein [Armatimonadota bacterium]
MTDLENKAIIPVESVTDTILILRGQRVILDSDLARLYGVSTGQFNQAVKRNLDRFPPDFMFQLTEEEHKSLRSQIVTLKAGRGQHRKYLPYAFTEHGAVMAASVLKTQRAVEVSVYVVRAFIQLRELLGTRTEIGRKLDELEQRLDGHGEQIKLILEAIQALIALPDPSDRRIGFRSKQENQ